MKKATLTLLMLVAFSYLSSANFKDMPNIQNRYGLLTVIDSFKKLRLDQNSYRLMINCICDCGKKSTADYYALKSGRIRSCGCQQRKKHGLAHHQLYHIWQAMVQRCTNEKCKYYAGYGGRGITVCDEWRHNPKIFVEWALSNGWAQGLSLDRRNNNGGYHPDNCHFTTRQRQQSNIRSSVVFTVDGITKTFSEWARFYGLPIATLRNRHLNMHDNFELCLYTHRHNNQRKKSLS